MDFVASAGAAEADSEISRSDLQSRYDGLKVVLNSIHEAGNKGFYEIQAVVDKYNTSLPTEFISELSSRIAELKQQMQTIILQSPDASRIVQQSAMLTQLQREKTEWESQKQQGYHMLEQLRQRNAALETQLKAAGVDLKQFNEEKQKWEEEKAQGYKLMAKYQEELAKSRAEDAPVDAVMADVGTRLQTPEATVAELMNELDTSHGAVAELQAAVSKLTAENQQLWRDLLTLKDALESAAEKKGGSHSRFRDTNGILFAPTQSSTEMEIARLTAMIESGYQQLVAVQKENERLVEDKVVLQQLNEEAQYMMKAHGIKALYRAATETDWGDINMQALQKEMEQARVDLAKDDLRRRFEAEDRLHRENQEELSRPPSVVGTGYVPDAAALGRGDSLASSASSVPSTTPVPVTDGSDTELLAKEGTFGAMLETPSGGNLFRPMTKTDWDAAQLAQLKNELQSEMQDMHQKQMQQLFERQDKLRHEEAHSGASTIESALIPSRESPDEEEKKVETAVSYHFGSPVSEVPSASASQIEIIQRGMKDELVRMQKEANAQMWERARRLRIPKEDPFDVSESKADLMKSEMEAQLDLLSKKALNEMFEKQQALRASEVPDPTKPIVFDPSELAMMSAEDRMDNLVRLQWAEGLSDDALEKMKEEYESAMRKERKQELMRTFERQDSLRRQEAAPAVAAAVTMEEAAVVSTAKVQTEVSADAIAAAIADHSIEEHPEFIEYTKRLQTAEKDLKRVTEELKNSAKMTESLSADISLLKTHIKTLQNSLQFAEESKVNLVEATADEIHKLRERIAMLCRGATDV